MLTPAALSILTTTYSGAHRATALAVWGALGAAGAAVGVVLGGVLTSWFGWQWVFFINVPIGVVASLVALFMVAAPATGAGRVRELDVGGAALLIAGLVMVVLTITAGAAHGWGSVPMLLRLVIAVGLLAGFAFTETRVPQPIAACRFRRSTQEPEPSSRHLYAGRRLGGKQMHIRGVTLRLGNPTLVRRADRN